jgi:hypothetical protein
MLKFISTFLFLITSLFSVTSLFAGQAGIEQKKPAFGGACEICP